jgi:hypothetical protein
MPCSSSRLLPLMASSSPKVPPFYPTLLFGPGGGRPNPLARAGPEGAMYNCRPARPQAGRYLYKHSPPEGLQDPMKVPQEPRAAFQEQKP